MLIEKIRKNLFIIFIIVVYMILAVINMEKALMAFGNTLYYLREMLIIMPIVFLLTALIDVWISKDMIIKGLGEKSGIRGSIVALILGSISAGPIYAAFPLVKTLLKKGASVSSVVVILSSWAVVKIPMLANESKFLGLEFMVYRWIFTVISIIIMGYLISKIVSKEDIINQRLKLGKNEIYVEHYSCIGCGICKSMAEDYFKIINKKAVVIKEIEDKDRKKIALVVEKCPVDSIKVGSLN